MFWKQFLLAILLPLTATAQAIPFSEAGQHVGKEITVTGKVSRVNTIASGMTFLNFGTRGGAGSFTAVARPGISDAATLKAFEGKEVDVTGTVELYKGSPQISLKSLESIQPAGATAPAEPTKTPDNPEPTKPIATGYAISSFEVTLERGEVRAAGKTHSGFVPEKTGVSVAVPENFQAGAGMKVLAVFPDFSGEENLEKLITPYAKVACAKGWIVVAAHSRSPLNELPPAWFASMFQAALRHLGTDYPGIAEAPLCLAGSSIGAGRATLGYGALVKEGYDVRGLFLNSLKWENFGESIRTFSPSKSKVRRTKVFVSHGSKDFMATPADSKKAADAIRNTDVEEVRYELHEGKGFVDPASLTKALDWFAEEK
ncbi:hypothetical protein HZ994_03310 [Akkermansiaceae bacterium]|nr:hypothetical protein HZ994_03310 [Akkermansiaceae bacterium]